MGVDRLRQGGLPVHEVEEASDHADVLGWAFRGDWVAGTARRRWRIILAIRHVLQTGVLSGRQLSRLVGHFTFLAMLRRGSLACLNLVYVFQQRHWDSPAPLWPGVRRELTWMMALVPLLEQRLSAEWLCEVLATDASEEGRGVVANTHESRESRGAGESAGEMEVQQR